MTEYTTVDIEELERLQAIENRVTKALETATLEPAVDDAQEEMKEQMLRHLKWIATGQKG